MQLEFNNVVKETIIKLDFLKKLRTSNVLKQEEVDVNM